MSTLLPEETYRGITRNIEVVMRGQSAAIRRLLAGFVSEGNSCPCLLESIVSTDTEEYLAITYFPPQGKDMHRHYSCHKSRYP
jgi:hypothetical protein